MKEPRGRGHDVMVAEWNGQIAAVGDMIQNRADLIVVEVLVAQRRTTVAVGPRRTRQCRGDTPRARKRKKR